MSAIQKIERIEQDFAEQNAPFDDVEFPEERLLREASILVGETDEPVALSLEDKATLVSAFATFDYNRNANQLVDNLLVLLKKNPKWFDAYKVPAAEKAMEDSFKKIGFRYGQRDAHAWYVNSEILRNKYHGKWTELLLETGLDAERLVERLRSDDFLVMKGAKVGPMYARIINDDVAELDNLWQLDIPVDTHIRRLSQDLFNAPDATDDEIRAEWRRLGEDHGVDRHIVDGGLWFIGNQWDNWGEEYWNSL